MDNMPPVEQSQPLPPGVSQAPPPGAAPAAPPMPAAPPPPPPVEKWDWLQIGAGVVIVTIACFSIYYFRYKTRQMPDAIKEQNDKISSLQSKLDKTMAALYPDDQQY